MDKQTDKLVLLTPYWLIYSCRAGVVGALTRHEEAGTIYTSAQQVNVALQTQSTQKWHFYDFRLCGSLHKHLLLGMSFLTTYLHSIHLGWDHQVFCIRERYLHITSDAQYSERATNGGWIMQMWVCTLMFSIHTHFTVYMKPYRAFVVMTMLTFILKYLGDIKVPDTSVM